MTNDQRPTANDYAYHPQQSVLKPHAGQRQTACMRYISASQRSHSIASLVDAAAVSAVLSGVIVWPGGRGGVGSDMAGIIAHASFLE
jgi:hypothetical protein